MPLPPEHFTLGATLADWTRAQGGKWGPPGPWVEPKPPWKAVVLGTAPPTRWWRVRGWDVLATLYLDYRDYIWALVTTQPELQGRATAAPQAGTWQVDRHVPSTLLQQGYGDMLLLQGLPDREFWQRLSSDRSWWVPPGQSLALVSGPPTDPQYYDWAVRVHLSASDQGPWA